MTSPSHAPNKDELFPLYCTIWWAKKSIKLIEPFYFYVVFSCWQNLAVKTALQCTLSWSQRSLCPGAEACENPQGQPPPGPAPVPRVWEEGPHLMPDWPNLLPDSWLYSPRFRGPRSEVQWLKRRGRRNCIKVRWDFLKQFPVKGREVPGRRQKLLQNGQKNPPLMDE